MTRARQAILLAWPSLRTAAWVAVLPVGALGLGVLTLDGPVVLELRLAAVALAAGAAFVLDDPAAETIAASPTPLLFRNLLRAALALPSVAVLWVLLLLYADAAPAWALTLELAAMLAATLAIAALAAPLVPDGRGGIAAAPALLVLLGAAALALPDGFTLFAAGPFDVRWDASHERWASILVAAVLAFVYASLDPGRARLLALQARREPLAAAGTTDPA